MVLPMLNPKTCPTLDAGSVLTNNTFRPCAVSVMAVAQAIEVLPTPPLPVKKRNRGGLSRNLMSATARGAAAALGAAGVGDVE